MRGVGEEKNHCLNGIFMPRKAVPESKECKPIEELAKHRITSLFRDLISK